MERGRRKVNLHNLLRVNRFYLELLKNQEVLIVACYLENRGKYLKNQLKQAEVFASEEGRRSMRWLFFIINSEEYSTLEKLICIITLNTF